MWPQYVLTGYLAWLCAGSLCEQFSKKQGARLLGSSLGYIARYSIIFYLLHAGGFYN